MKAIAKLLYPEIFQHFENVNRQLEHTFRELDEKRQELIRMGSSLLQYQDELVALKESLSKVEEMYTDRNQEYQTVVETLNTLRYQYDQMEQELQNELELDAAGIKDKYERVMSGASHPWCIFEIQGFDQQGIKINFNWNEEFIHQIRKLGFDSESDEENVQSFFAIARMAPPSFIDTPNNDIS